MNLVITISRRFGTGASLIAQELSEKLGVPVYDKAYIEHELDGAPAFITIFTLCMH